MLNHISHHMPPTQLTGQEYRLFSSQENFNLGVELPLVKFIRGN